MSSNLAFTVIVLGGFAIGAWLVISGHPWFAVLVIILTASVSFKEQSK